MSAEGIVKLRLTAVSDPQHGGFATGSSPVSWGSLDELFVNLTVPRDRLELDTDASGKPVSWVAQAEIDRIIYYWISVMFIVNNLTI